MSASPTRLALRTMLLIGLVGSPAFILSWFIAGALEPGYSHRSGMISDLAAANATHAWIVAMGIGLSAIGLGTFAFVLRAQLRHVTGEAGCGPAMLVIAALAIGVMAAIPMDCRSTSEVCAQLLTSGQASWHAYAHAAAGATAFGMLGLAPIVLARRFAGDPDWGSFARPSAGIGLLLLIGASVLFAGPATIDGWAGLLQRVIIVVSMGWGVLVGFRAYRLWTTSMREWDAAVAEVTRGRLNALNEPTSRSDNQLQETG